MTEFVTAGDCLEKLQALPDNSIDAVITDPPYGLSDHKPKDTADALTAWLSGQPYLKKGKGYMGSTWDSFVPGPEVWKECFRVLKPGGYLAAFAGSRTQDLMGIAIRLGGFELRDTVSYMYGTGFPHSHNFLNDQGEKQGTNLKPAYEPVILARKPLEGSVQENFAKWGTGALAIDRSRIEKAEGGEGYWPSNILLDDDAAAVLDASQNKSVSRFFYTTKAPREEREAGLTEDVMLCTCKAGNEWEPEDQEASTQPASDTLPKKDTTECQLTMGDATSSPTYKSGSSTMDPCPTDTKSTTETKTNKTTESTTFNSSMTPYTNAFIPDADCEMASGGSLAASAESSSLSDESTGTFPKKAGRCTEDVVLVTSEKSAKHERLCGYCGKLTRKSSASDLVKRKAGSAGIKHPSAGAGRTDTEGRWCSHPTVKIIALMRWLIDLVVPEGGVVLDPFAGSGSTGCAAVLEGRKFMGFELSEEYALIANARIAHWEKTAEVRPGEVYVMSEPEFVGKLPEREILPIDRPNKNGDLFDPDQIAPDLQAAKDHIDGLMMSEDFPRG